MVKQYPVTPPPPRPPENGQTQALRRALQLLEKLTAIECTFVEAEESENRLVTLRSQRLLDIREAVLSQQPMTTWTVARPEIDWLKDQDFNLQELLPAFTVLDRSDSKNLPRVWARYDSHSCSVIGRVESTDLRYLQGTTIEVIDRCGDDWGVGACHNQFGLFPWAHAKQDALVRAIKTVAAKSDYGISFAKGDIFPLFGTIVNRPVGFHNLEYGFFTLHDVVPVDRTLSSLFRKERDSLHFKYNPIASHEIRIVNITKDHVQQYLKCDGSTIFLGLQSVPLDCVPSYTALSYCWGDYRNTESIFCNDQLLNVPVNLARSIRWLLPTPSLKDYQLSLAENWSDVYIWADAICVNQKDVLEKNHQVPLMEVIYERAQVVRLYVNESSKSWDLTSSLETIQHLGKVTSEWAVVDHEANASILSGIDWNSVHDFAIEPAFRRSWIVQELILGKQVQIQYGHSRFSILQLHNAVMTIHTRGLRHPGSLGGPVVKERERLQALDQGMLQLLRLGEIRSNRLIGKLPDFITILDHFRNTQAKDHRDKVYSMLSLADEGYRNALAPNYSEPNTTCQVFKQLAQHAVRRPEVTKLLQAAGLRRAITGLPSWVPDWTIESRAPLISTIYKCSGKSAAHVQCSGGDFERLRVRGVIVDRIVDVNSRWPIISDLSRPMGAHYSDFDLEGYREDCFAIRVNFELTVLMHRVARLVDDDHAKVEDVTTAVWQTITCEKSWSNAGRAAPYEKRHYDAFLKRYGGVVSLNASGTYSMPGPEPADFDDKKLIEDIHPFFSMMLSRQIGRRTAMTTMARPATIPAEAMEGDFVAIFSGFNIPFVIRKVETADQNGPLFQLVGDCYIHGIMDGELLEEVGELSIQEAFATGKNQDASVADFEHPRRCTPNSSGDIRSGDAKNSQSVRDRNTITSHAQVRVDLSLTSTGSEDDFPETVAFPGEVKVKGAETIDIILI